MHYIIYINIYIVYRAIPRTFLPEICTILGRLRAILTARRHRSEAHRSLRWPPGRQLQRGGGTYRIAVPIAHVVHFWKLAV